MHFMIHLKDILVKPVEQVKPQPVLMRQVRWASTSNSLPWKNCQEPQNAALFFRLKLLIASFVEPPLFHRPGWARHPQMLTACSMNLASKASCSPSVSTSGGQQIPHEGTKAQVVVTCCWLLMGFPFIKIVVLPSINNNDCYELWMGNNPQLLIVNCYINNQHQKLSINQTWLIIVCCWCQLLSTRHFLPVFSSVPMRQRVHRKLQPIAARFTPEELLALGGWSLVGWNGLVGMLFRILCWDDVWDTYSFWDMWFPSFLKHFEQNDP